MNYEMILKTIDIHFFRLSQAAKEMEGIDNAKIDTTSFETVKLIDSFVFRFSKVQDLMGNKLFPEVLAKILEYNKDMHFLDVLNKMEKFGYIPSKEMWIDFRELRNKLTHEYPDDEGEIIESINSAIDAYKIIKEIYLNLKVKFPA